MPRPRRPLKKGARRPRRAYRNSSSTHWKRRSTNSMYRNPVPRTLQLATRRNKAQTLRFVANQVYKVVPGGSVGGMENVFLTIRANSIYDIMKQNGSHLAAGTFIPQDAALYGPSMNPNADGYEKWEPRYQHFCVLGSKIQATFVPTHVADDKDPVPTTFYITKTGESGQLAAGTTMAHINKLPYQVKAHIVPSKSWASATNALSHFKDGVRLSMTYSARKFEGVTDVLDNSQLKGKFIPSSQPAETSFFNVGMRNIIPSGAANDRMPEGILTLKVEYIVRLVEPTDTNEVQAPSGWF